MYGHLAQHLGLFQRPVKFCNVFDTPTVFMNNYPCDAPVAQLDRVLGFEPSGRRFESFRARHYCNIFLHSSLSTA